jgi:hypothetical protein
MSSSSLWQHGLPPPSSTRLASPSSSGRMRSGPRPATSRALLLRVEPSLADRLSTLDAGAVEARLQEATRAALSREMPRAQGVYLVRFEPSVRGVPFIGNFRSVRPLPRSPRGVPVETIALSVSSHRECRSAPRSRSTPWQPPTRRWPRYATAGRGEASSCRRRARRQARAAAVHRDDEPGRRRVWTTAMRTEWLNW